ncbi:MAG: T9SS type A sorting domain-containing protein [Candidatus Cloacimonetes bacterium]|jgi:predicted outer membrane repeat protein|nr:T9SS type A sorting domain-containing protein [Candidatus Cloacimonadota bacterium]
MKNVFLVLFLIVFFNLSATIINIPADQPTIQAGINVTLDSDTVLVQTGTYYENINYNGKNITIASLFLTTQDTTYIYSTIIDGNYSGCVVKFINGEDSTAVLSGFTIANGYGSGNPPGYTGGGITCDFNSSPSLNNLNVVDNLSGYGGGIYINNSSPIIENISIINNFSSSMGGGIYIHDSSPNLNLIIIMYNSGMNGGGIVVYGDSFPSMENLVIKENTSNLGGGIHFWNSQTTNSLVLKNSVISENSANFNGGGISCGNYNLYLENVVITNNQAELRGGGIYCYNNSNLTLENVNIISNYANDFGAGIYIDSSDLNFDVENRCNIYLNDIQNSRGFGSDIFADDCEIINVIVDTFTVIMPSDYYVSPINNFTFDILNGKEDNLINSDLYVAVDGDNNNSGLTPDEPLKTINYTLSRIYADSLNQNTIYLAPGIYSNSSNNEIFPIEWISYVSLIGSDADQTILDAENLDRVMNIKYVENVLIQGITIRNGFADNGAGIYCPNSDPVFENVIIKSNYTFYDASRGGGAYFAGSEPSLTNVIFMENSSAYGGGICFFSSNPYLENVIIIDNSASEEGGGIYFENSEPILNNVTVTENSANYDGGGIYFGHSYNSLAVLENVIISENHANNAGGGIYCYYLDIELHEVTILQNTASSGGGIFMFYSLPEIQNVIIVNNSATFGGGVYTQYDFPTFINTTITDNISEFGSGIYCTNESSPLLINCVLWNNTNEVYFDSSSDSSTVTISYSDIQGGEAGIITNNNGTVNWLEGNINEDPLFLGIGEYPYSLFANSPCIDTGTLDLPPGIELPEYDLAGNPRIYGDTIDMGAYEWQGTPVSDEELVVRNWELSNYPNPFNPTTTISFSIPEETKVDLSIYNIKGQKIKSLLGDQISAGEHSIVWNGVDASGKKVGSGIYLYKLNINGKTEAVRKCLLLK